MDKEQNNLPQLNKVIRKVFFLISLIFILFFIELAFNQEWYWLGLRPRRIIGLLGILTSPFKHHDISHLLNNSLLLIVLLFGFFIHFFHQKPYGKILTISIICNIWLWIIGRDAWHYGASGVVYGLFFYMLYIAIFHKRKELFVYLLSCLMLSIGFFAGLFPGKPNISFESHVLGGISGLLVAFFEKKRKKFKNPTNNISFTSEKDYHYEFKENTK